MGVARQRRVVVGLVQGQGQLADWLVGLERLEQEACVGGWPRDSPPYDIRRIRDPRFLPYLFPPPTNRLGHVGLAGELVGVE